MSAAAQALKVAATTEPTAERKALADMKPKEQIAYLLQQKRGEIAKMLPRHLDAERLLKVAQIAATTTPQLAKCDVASLVGAIGQCAQVGLEPNTVLGHAYLVPFNTKRKDTEGNERWVNSVQVIVGYKGLIALARRSGQIVSISARDVCEADKFELVYGLDETLEHRPAMGERGAVIGFYAIAQLKDGGHAIEWMSRSQVEKVRDGSPGWQQALKYKNTASHPWEANFVEMGRKTVIRRLAKYLPLSVEFQQAAQLDEQAAAGIDQHLDATIDGDFLPVADEETGMGNEAQALTDDSAEQQTRTVAKAAEPEKEKTRSKSAGKPEVEPSLWEKVEGFLRRAEATTDEEIRLMLIDEMRPFVAELAGENKAEADARIAVLMKAAE